MTNLILITIMVIIILILGAAIAVMNAKLNQQDTKEDDEDKPSESHPYSLKKFILTPAEYSFYKVLIMHLPENLSVLIKIRLADILEVSKEVDRSERRTAQNKINSKHFDFIIVDKKTCTVQSVIELDDSSHTSKKAQSSDQFKNEACKASTLTIHRVPAKRGYSADDINPLFAAANV